MAAVGTPRTRRLEPSDESGLTLVELLMTMAVLSIVLAGAYSFLNSLMTNDRYQEALVNNQEKVRFAMTEMARDIRNANPLITLSAVADYPDQIEMWVGPTTGTQTRVRWVLSGTTLTRRVLDPTTGAVTSTRTALSGVDNATEGVALFKYYDEANNQMSAVTSSPADYANCTIRVRITVVATDDPVGSQFTESVDAEVRNQLPGGIGCAYTTTTTT